MKRRELLTWSAGTFAGLALSACGRPRVAAPLLKVCTSSSARGAKTITHAELLKRFRELECLTTAMTYGKSVTDAALANRVKTRFLELHSLMAPLRYDNTLAEAWRRFYGLTARLHEARNARARAAKMPVYAYNGHHHAARLWIDERARRGKLGPLLHFDSHHDMRGLSDSKLILEATSRLEHGGDDRKSGLSQLRRLINDPATPVSGGVLGRAFDEVVWAAPNWAQIHTMERRPFFYASVPMGPDSATWFSLLHDSSAGELPRGEGKHAVPWIETNTLTPEVRDGVRDERPIRLSFIKTHPRREATLARLKRLVPRGKFILDIDLDYFLSIDQASGFTRPSSREIVMPGQKFDYDERLTAARELVDTRLAGFRRLIRDLRAAQRVPSMVTLADSTYRPFDTVVAGMGYWEYMPYEFAGYVHWRVRQLLAEVYKGDGVEAGV